MNPRIELFHIHQRYRDFKHYLNHPSDTKNRNLVRKVEYRLCNDFFGVPSYVHARKMLMYRNQMEKNCTNGRVNLLI